MPKFLDVTDKVAARAALEIGDGYEPVNVKHYGAVGDGVADDTEAIETAWEQSYSLYFPPGIYVYNGPGLNIDSVAVVYVEGSGQDQGGTIIQLGDNSYLFDIDEQLYGSIVSNIDIRGGKGALRHTYTGLNVGDRNTWTNVRFYDYTECAWASDSEDMPMVNFLNCYFKGGNTTSTIGVALSGLTDQCSFINCDFTNNRVHVKLRQGGNNAHFINCGFIKFSSVNSSGPRADVWVVPEETAVNAGNGFGIRDCKFGNEYLVSGDYRILYADEQAAGSTNGTKMPRLDADSTGYIIGHNIEANAFVHIGWDTNPIIYSTTPNVSNISVANNQIAGGSPSYVIQYRTAPTAADRSNSQNTFGPFHGDFDKELDFLRLSNANGVGYRVDPAGNFQEATSVRPSAGCSVNYSGLSSDAITAYQLSNVTRSNVTDAYGGADAAKLTMNGTFPVAFASLSAMTPGMPVWIEFDLKNPDDGNQATSVQVWVSESGGNFHFRRTVQVPPVSAGWVTYAFSFVPRTAGSSHALAFGNTMGVSISNKTVTVGRPRIYHSTERVLGGRKPAITGERSTGGAVASLLSSLAGQGFITDSTTAGATVATESNTLNLTNKTLLSPKLYAATTNEWQPVDQGFISWSYDPASITAAEALSAGVLYVSAVKIPVATTITNVHLAFAAAGSTLTADQCIAGLYQGGTLLASTADQSTAWASGTGLKTMALSSPQTVTAGIVHVAWFWNGTTSPQFYYAPGPPNLGLSAASFRGGYWGSGFTTTLAGTLGTLIANTSHWAAVS